MSDSAVLTSAGSSFHPCGAEQRRVETLQCGYFLDYLFIELTENVPNISKILNDLHRDKSFGPVAQPFIQQNTKGERLEYFIL